MTTVKRVPIQDLIYGTLSAWCGSCGYELEITQDPEGVWVSCPCDQGYVDGPYIMAIPDE